jgi:hypothetical protein
VPAVPIVAVTSTKANAQRQTQHSQPRVQFARAPAGSQHFIWLSKTS